MAIFEPTTMQLPYRACVELEVALQELAPHTDPVTRNGLRIFQRPLNDGDGDESIGIYPDFWDPDEESTEMRGHRGATQATFAKYPIIVQALVRDSDQVPGMARHSYLAALVKQELIRSEHLEAVLPGLEIDLRGRIEKVTKYGVERQRYSVEFGALNSFLSTTTFYVETQI